MSRRWSGLILMTVALVVGIALPGLGAGRLAGRAAAAPPPGPPRVGDCLTGPFSIPSDPSGSVVAYPHPATSTCPSDGGTRYGEVMRVVPAPEPVTASTDPVGGGVTTADGNLHDCRDTLPAFLGLDVRPGAATPWEVDLGVRAVMIGPSDRQRAVGQTWAACLAVVPESGDTPHHDGVAAVAYRGALRDAVHTGGGADRFGSCFADTAAVGPQPVPVDCAAPHTAELLARAYVEAPDGDELNRTCGGTVASLTGRSDRTLPFVVLGVTQDRTVIVPPDATPSPGAEFYCVVTTVGRRTLTGSVIGLGDRPLPWG